MESQDIVNIINETGPLTGWQLLEKSGMEALPLWQICRQTPEIRAECAGRRYLRLDRNVEGYARLSPSIRREFLTYTVLGLENQGPSIEARAQKLSEEVQQISRAKFDLARESMISVVQSLPVWESIQDASLLHHRRRCHLWHGSCGSASGGQHGQNGSRIGSRHHSNRRG